MDFFFPASDLKSFHFLGPVDPVKEHIKAIQSVDLFERSNKTLQSQVDEILTLTRKSEF